MANHLIIGLGGTGGKVLREMRKRVYEEFHSNEPTNNINLEYIYVDSSPADLDNRTGWKVMGKSVHLKEAQKVSIHGVSASMFSNLSMYPGVECFLNSDDINLMTSKLGPLITAGIGGQRRRLGRTLLANNMSVRDANSDFVSRVKQAVTRITQTSGDAAVTFHICAGLAGGTGSGSIIDAVSQIRKEFPPQPGANGDRFKVNLYLYVPEMNLVNSDHDSGFYQANGYAALSELNAMSIGKYLPLDVTGQKDNYTGEVQRLLNGINAFEAAYLYSNVNEAGKILDLALGLPASVADFIFQKIVASEMSGDAGKMSRLVGCENNGAGPEMDRANQPARSRKFLAFGIKRIEYPETEIEEFVTYNFARQAARQLQFNLWQEGIGFAETSLEEVGSGFAAEIKDRKNRERLMLSNNYLMLSKPIIESAGTKRWHDIDSTWEERTQGFADDAQTEADKKSWLAIFSDACTDYFEKNFRALGVKKFYETQRGERSAYAKAIRRHIETLLFNEWQSGQKSILEIEKYTSLLIADCTERISDIKDQIAKMEEELEDCNERIRQCNIEWDNIGWLRDAITGASKKVFSAYKTAKCELYTTATRIEAYRFATELMQAVIEQLGLMKDGVVQYKSILAAILEEVARQADSKCKKDEDADETGIQKKYDPDMVQRFTKACVVNKETQSDNALSIRNKLVKALGEDGERSFGNLCDRTDYETASDIILDVCQTTARAAMENAAQADPLNKMLGVNILEKLKQEYNTEDKLEQLVRSMINSAKPYLQFNAEEQAKNFPGGGNMMQMVQLCIPKFEDDNSGFRDKLINAFVQIYPGFNPKEDVSINYKNNQIVVVAAASGFPLRYVSNVKVLKKRYEDMLASPDSDLNKMVLHTETFAKPLPSLFEMDIIEIKEMVTPYVMKAYAFNLFVEKSDPTTGAHFDAINFPDEFGDDNWVRAGKDLIATIDVLGNDYDLAQKVMALVDQKMKTECRTNDQKVALRKELVAVLKEKILPSASCENNEFSPVYARYKGIAREIMENELKEL